MGPEQPGRKGTSDSLDEPARIPTHIIVQYKLFSLGPTLSFNGPEHSG